MSSVRRVEEVCEDFERAWSNKFRPDFHEYCGLVDESQRQELMKQLLQIDVELRLKSGHAIELHDYRSLGEEALQIVQEEVELQDTLHTMYSDDSDSSVNSLQSKSPEKFIGPFKLLHKIGEGGMGTVWMAEQKKPVRRRVALKVIRADRGSKETIARFEAERQALTMMDHNSIARVLDAGTTNDGNPFFVMELVNGVPITEFCDEHRLTLHERLRLMVDVCKAVQHAHQKGIIHRDLKPSNILVTQYENQPVPKVIDFGLAKALEHTTLLTDKTVHTEVGQVVGTLQYMSPEQAEMSVNDIDTRTDVYALGVVLYELLTGSTPLERATLANNALFQVLEIIREREPQKPSDRMGSTKIGKSTVVSEHRKMTPTKLRSILHGELDWIVMRSLEIDRSRRYDTALALADDIQRFLSDEPVQARPPTARYLIAKFVKKHRVAFMAASLLVFSLLAGIAGTTWFSIQANHSKREAQLAQVKADKEAKRALEEAQNAKDSQQEAEAALAGTRYVVANLRRKQARVDEALALLKSIPDQYREVDFFLSSRELSGSDLTIKAHVHGGRSVAWSDNGSWLASSGDDKSIAIWDASNGQLIEKIDLEGQPAHSITFSPDSSLLAYGQVDGQVSVVNTSDWKVVHSTDTANENVVFFGSLTFDHDGKRLAFFDKWQGMLVWDFESIRILEGARPYEGRPVDTTSGFVSFNRRGDKIQYSNKFGVHSLSVLTGEKNDTLISNESRLTDLPYSIHPIGRQLVHVEASGALGSKDRIRVVETSSSEVSFLDDDKQENNQIQNLIFSPDGRRLCSVRGNKARIWTMNGQSQSVDLIGHETQINSVAFSPDGRRVATVSFDGDLKVWACTGEQHLTLHVAPEPILGISYSKDDKKIFAASDSGLFVYSTDPYEQTLVANYSDPHPVSNGGVAYGIGRGNGYRHAIVRFQTSKSAKIEKSIEIQKRFEGGPRLQVDQIGAHAIVYSEAVDAQKSGKPAPMLFDLGSGKFVGHLNGSIDQRQESYEIGSVKFCNDGKRILIAKTPDEQEGAFVEVWDTKEIKLVATLPFADADLSLEFDLQNNRLFTHSGELIQAWSTDSWKETDCLNTPNKGPPTRITTNRQSRDSVLRFHPDRQRLSLASGSKIAIFDLNTGDETMEISCGAVVRDLQWNPAGSEITGAFDDGTIKVWLAKEPSESFRIRKSKIDHYWHANEGDIAEQNKNWFAAVFHRAWQLNYDPDQFLAWDLLHDAYERYQHESTEAAKLTSRFVKNMLEIERGKLPQKINLGVPRYEFISDFRNKLLDPEFNISSIRPRFDRSVLEIVLRNNNSYASPLLLLDFREGRFEQAIDRAEKSLRRHRGGIQGAFELCVIAMSHEKLGNEADSRQAADRIAELMKEYEEIKTSSNRRYVGVDDIYAEFTGDKTSSTRGNLKASRSNLFGLPSTVWPARVPNRSLSNNRGGGVF